MSKSTDKWDLRFMLMAGLVAEWSKDPSTKAGAVITDSSHRILSTGFNGFPQGVPDHPSLLADREMKYQLIMHAELNAILFAESCLHGSTLYVNQPPCPRCAATIAQAGIARVVTSQPDEGFMERWGAGLKVSELIYQARGIKYDLISEE